MKILTTILISLPLICAPLTASADKGGNKGPSDQAYERANDNASFKRGDDYEKHDTWKKQKGGHDGPDRDDHGSRDPNQYRDDRRGDHNYRDYSKRDGGGDGSRDSNRDHFREQNRDREKSRDNTDAGGNRGGGESQ